MEKEKSVGWTFIGLLGCNTFSFDDCKLLVERYSWKLYWQSELSDSVNGEFDVFDLLNIKGQLWKKKKENIILEMNLINAMNIKSNNYVCDLAWGLISLLLLIQTNFNYE